MLDAHIRNGDRTAVIELPTDRFNLQWQLRQLRIDRKPEDFRVLDDMKYNTGLTLTADSDIGKALAGLFTSSHSLEEVNRCAHLVQNSKMEIREELEQKLLYEQYASPQELMDDIRTMTEDLVAVEVNYYCPLKIQMNDEKYGDFYEIDNGYAVANEEAIRERLKKEQDFDLNDMADYFDGSAAAKAKLISAVWDVENIGGELFGVIHTKLREAFTPAEEQEWIEELTGQAADGFGEGFEQREIKTDDGDMYVSFWHGGDDYFMENESDFQAWQMDQQQIGGM